MRAYTPTEFFKPKMHAFTRSFAEQPSVAELMMKPVSSFKDMIPTIEAISALQRTAPTSRDRARHLSNLYSYMSDHILLLYTEPKHLPDFANKARDLLSTIPAHKKGGEYEAVRDALEMFITLSGE